MKIKILLKVYFKVLVVILVGCLAWTLLTPVFRIDENKEGEQFRNLPENILDVIILGSSHAQYSMNPAVIYEESGYYSYVLGSGCQPMPMSLHFLKEALKTQQPEVVLLDVFTMMPARAVCYGDGIYYLAIQQMSGMNRFEAASKIENKEKINDYRFDLLMNHNKWKYDSFKKSEPHATYNQMLGYVAQQPKEFEFNHLVQYERGDTKVSFRESDIEALNEIIDVCKENNIKLVLFKAAIDIDQENYDYLQAIWDIAISRGIEYIDFLDIAEDIGFTLGMDGDTWHNNTWGAQKCSKYMAHYLSEKGYITKHKDNAQYDKLLNNLSDATVKSLMNNNIDVYQLLDYAAKYDLNVLVKYTGAYHTSIGEYENEILQKIGINFDFRANMTQNYYALISDQQEIQSSNTPFVTEFEGHHISIANDAITVDDQTFENLGELELIFFGENFEWSWEMPVDYASRFFWRNGCDGWTCREGLIQN